jgi:hypothetical protein
MKVSRRKIIKNILINLDRNLNLKLNEFKEQPIYKEMHSIE